MPPKKTVAKKTPAPKVEYDDVSSGIESESEEIRTKTEKKIAKACEKVHGGKKDEESDISEIETTDDETENDEEKSGEDTDNDTNDDTDYETETEEVEDDQGEDDDSGNWSDDSAEGKREAGCHYKNFDKIDIITDGDDDANEYMHMKYTENPREKWITPDELNFYEITRIIGTRAQMINKNAKIYVENVDGLHPAVIAYIELKHNRIPFIIRRYLPNKMYEDRPVQELELIHEINDPFFNPGKY